jgi:predicted small secreted protein
MVNAPSVFPVFFFYFLQISTDFVCIQEKVVTKYILEKKNDESERQLKIIINSKYQEDNVEMFLMISYIHRCLVYLKRKKIFNEQSLNYYTNQNVL